MNMKRTLCADCVALLPKNTRLESLSLGGMPVVFRSECDECGNTTSVASIRINTEERKA